MIFHQNSLVLHAGPQLICPEGMTSLVHDQSAILSVESRLTVFLPHKIDKPCLAALPSVLSPCTFRWVLRACILRPISDFISLEGFLFLLIRRTIGLGKTKSPFSSFEPAPLLSRRAFEFTFWLCRCIRQTDRLCHCVRQTSFLPTLHPDGRHRNLCFAVYNFRRQSDKLPYSS